MIFRNLRVRISVAFFAVSLVLSSLFAVATFLSFEFVRPWFSEERFDGDLDHFVDGHLSDPYLSGPRTGTWKTPSYVAYVAEPHDLSTLPERLRALEPGRHQIEHEGEPSEIQIEDRRAFRYLIEYDIEQILAIEREVTGFLIALLGGGVLLLSLLALGFGYWMSSRIIQPVTSLARRVEELDAQESLELGGGIYGTDEVADLARAFERYFRRLGNFVQREREFAADASHELRTGVASISSSVELLMTEEHGERTRARLQRLQRASRHMSQLIEALLVLARASATADGSVPMSRIAVGPALREIVEGRRQAAAEHGVDLSLELGRAGEVTAPLEGLTIVVGNLIDNAIAYATDGEICVRLDSDLIEVSDTGPGIPEHELPYVFQRAFRGRDSAGCGAGLGLAIVQRLCEHSGWQIDIDSPSGLGTTVRIDLAPRHPLGLS